MDYPTIEIIEHVNYGKKSQQRTITGKLIDTKVDEEGVFFIVSEEQLELLENGETFTTPQYGEINVYYCHKVKSKIIREPTKDRQTELLKAVVQLLEKQNDSTYVLDILATEVFYDGAECDGGCLLTDIKVELGIEED